LVPDDQELTTRHEVAVLEQKRQVLLEQAAIPGVGPAQARHGLPWLALAHEDAPLFVGELEQFSRQCAGVERQQRERAQLGAVELSPGSMVPLAHAADLRPRRAPRILQTRSQCSRASAVVLSGSVWRQTAQPPVFAGVSWGVIRSPLVLGARRP